MTAHHKEHLAEGFPEETHASLTLPISVSRVMWPARALTLRRPLMSSVLLLERIGVGIDTARYGHRVSFLQPDHQPAAKPITVQENHAGYQNLRKQLEHLHQLHPQAQFHIRIDAAGQYAANLESFLRRLELPMIVSIGEPKRNKDYQKAHFPKRTSDDTESQAMARFAVVEQPQATPAPVPEMVLLREVTGRLQAQVKQSTQAINRLHNLMARVFPELATLTDDITAHWVLDLFDKYPSAERIAQARLTGLAKVPYLPDGLAPLLHEAAQHSVASLRGDIAETLVRELVAQLRHCQAAEQAMRNLLEKAYNKLPTSAHVQVVTVPGVGVATAAVLIAKIVDINRFDCPDRLVGFFGVFPEENSSGVDKYGKPLPLGTLRMSRKGNDLARAYLWNAARSAITCNPAIRALYKRLRSKGKRGDVALGHCMRKLLHLVYAVWKTNRPFDKNHYPWQPSTDTPMSTTPALLETAPVNDEAVGHKRALPAKEVVTTASPTVAPPAAPVKTVVALSRPSRPRIDFTFLRQQVTMEQALTQLGLLADLRGRGHQRRGRCPIHGQAEDASRTFSVHLGKNVFQCFQADCAAQGNVLDLWAAVHRLPLYEAALNLAQTFQVPRNREEEPVREPVQAGQNKKETHSENKPLPNATP